MKTLLVIARVMGTVESIPETDPEFRKSIHRGASASGMTLAAAMKKLNEGHTIQTPAYFRRLAKAA